MGSMNEILFCCVENEYRGWTDGSVVRTPVTLVEDLGSVPSTYMAAHNSSSGGFDNPLLTSTGTGSTHTLIQAKHPHA